MSDERLREIEERAGSAARAADFGEIAARGHRRRRTTTVTVVGATAAIVGVIVAGAHTLTEDSSAPTRPAHTATAPTKPPATTHPAPPGHGRDPASIVFDPNARLDNVAIARDDAEVRASIWSIECRGCADPREALAVTRDGFSHTAFLSVPSWANVTWLGGDDFVVWNYQRLVCIVDASGTRRPIRLNPDTSPLTPSETLVGVGKSSNFFAVSRDGSAHRIPMPKGASFLGELTQSGQNLWGFADGATDIVSSPDGGATWRTPHKLGDGPYFETVDGNYPGVLAAVALGEDGILFPSGLWRSVDSGGSWQEINPPQFRGMDAGWLLVLRDGRLLVEAARESGPQQVPAGLYESDDSSWLTFHRIQLTHRPVPGYFLGYEAFEVDDPQSGESLYAVGDGGGGGYVSTDGGRVWRSTPIR